MSSQKPLSANEVALMLSEMTGLDVMALARVANIPLRNMQSWLAGAKDNIAVESVMDLLSLLGMRFDPEARLDSRRVHCWRLRRGVVGGRSRRRNPIAALGKLFGGCRLARIEGPSARWFGGNEFFFVVGNGVRVLVKVDGGLFGRPLTTPASFGLDGWYNDAARAISVRDESLWSRVLEADLTPAEFDVILEGDPVTWSEVSLIARTHNLTAKEIAEWAASRSRCHEPRSAVLAQDHLEEPAESPRLRRARPRGPQGAITVADIPQFRPPGRNVA